MKSNNKSKKSVVGIRLELPEVASHVSSEIRRQARFYKSIQIT